MAKIFISHSSKDSSEAKQLKEWLEVCGFEFLFLDFDAEHGIKPGSNWEKKLFNEISKAHAFIFLLSESWENSTWCGFEFLQARALGKTIFPVLIQRGFHSQVASDIQDLDLTKNRKQALDRLNKALTELTLNTQRGFSWDRFRSPYPGMVSFESKDAAVFFGRDNEINRLRERLDSHRTQGNTALLVVLASSGAGKSSLLRAGLLPQMKRNHQCWLILDVLRPENSPLRKLAQVLSQAMNTPSKWRKLYQQLQSDNAINVLSDYLDDLKSQHKQLDATILLSIDQAEELLSSSNQEDSNKFLRLLVKVQEFRLPLITMMAMRSDFLESLQKHPAMKDKTQQLNTELFSLEALPINRISALIKEPAKVAGLVIDDELVIQATRDASTEDTLPLLAFTLRELYDRFGKSGKLTLESYKSLGSNSLSPMENAVQEKANQAIKPDNISSSELQALQEAFIPHMVKINESGEYIRSPAKWFDLPTLAHPLLEQLTRARLLVQHQSTDETERYIEIAHEALFRHWTLLKSWLHQEHDFLVGKQQLESSLRDWENLPKERRGEALLRGISLERSREWLLSNRSGLNDSERAYIQESIRADTNRKKKQRYLLISFILALLVTTAIAVWQALRAQNENTRTELSLSEANNLIEFINYELRDKLKPIGRLDIMGDIQSRVSKYYRNLGNNITNRSFLREQAINLEQQGETYALQGNYEIASELYTAARIFIESSLVKNPSNSETLRTLSVNLDKTGDLLLSAGNTKKARSVFEKSQTIIKSLIKLNPNNQEWQRDLGVSFQKIGDTYLETGNLEAAMKNFQGDLSITIDLVKTDSMRSDWQYDLATSYDRLSKVLMLQAKIDEAIAYQKKHNVLMSKLVKQNPENTVWKNAYASGWSQIAELFSMQGKTDAGSDALHLSIEAFHELTQLDPSNIEWARSHSKAKNLAARVLMEKSAYTEAQSMFDESLRIFQKLTMTPGASVDMKMELVVTYVDAMNIMLDYEQLHAAKHYGQQAIKMLSPLINQGLLSEDQAEWATWLSSEVESLEQD